MTDISNSDATIDSRDVIKRIEELENEREALALIDAVNAVDCSAPHHAQDRADLKYWEEDNLSELDALASLADEAPQYSEDWQYGATLIRDSSFTDYAQELCEDLGYLPNDFPAWIEIDWKATARNIQQDYTSVEFDGVTYWVR
jgi:hypothetical protein